MPDERWVCIFDKRVASESFHSLIQCGVDIVGVHDSEVGMVIHPGVNG
jgi:hypothetical protein